MKKRVIFVGIVVLVLLCNMNLSIMEIFISFSLLYIYFNFIEHNRECLHEGQIKVVKFDYDNNEYEKIEMKDNVSIIITNREEEVLLLEVFRPAIGEYCLELPGSSIDCEVDVNFMFKLLRDKCNIQGDEVDFIGRVSSHYLNSDLTDAIDTIYHISVSSENNDNTWVTIDDLKSMLDSGLILNNNVYRAYYYLKQI